MLCYCYHIFIVNFEHVIAGWDLCPHIDLGKTYKIWSLVGKGLSDSSRSNIPNICQRALYDSPTNSANQKLETSISYKILHKISKVNTISVNDLNYNHLSLT